jgi:hypothetical protein
MAFIGANFSSLMEGIKCLQEKGGTLEDSLALLYAYALNDNMLLVLQAVSERARVMSVRFRIWGTTPLGNGLQTPRWELKQNSNSPRRGHINAIPSPVRKLERGN